MNFFLSNDNFVDVNECASNPCLGKRTCVDKVNGYKCTCPAGFNGTNCEISKAFLSLMSLGFFQFDIVFEFSSFYKLFVT